MLTHLPHPLEDNIRSALERSVERKNSIKSGAEIFYAMSPCKHLYIIQKGVVKISMLLIDGREQVTGFYIEGEMFGFDGLAMQSHQCEASALTDVDVSLIPLAAIFNGGEHAQLLSEFLLNIMSREIRRDQRTIAILGALSAEEKIIAFMLNLSYRQMLRQRSAEVLDMPMSRADIGNFLGITSETVSRSLTKLQREKLIELDGREIRIIALDRLKDRVGPSFS